ncbi:unnamed protein product [Rotaria sordida]|uniref:Disease resistance R13L4/SHOC-2-like LRR domain-containing protein n=1 Tax=Rotaria sordida TaxID=392033 RepID=A0A814DEG6_9BILA|nr:unnamed protein product [Rotaria sordida]
MANHLGNVSFRNNSSINCSQYKDDYAVLLSFPFHVDLNPLLQIPRRTNGLMDAKERIYYLNIINQKYVPLTIYCLKYLQKLYIRNTSFYNTNHQLPIEIDYLASTLTHLSIYDTKITHLPEQIGKLKYLQSLELVNTNLITLPNSIGNLSSLIVLYLPNNKLISLPKTIKNIQSLSQIVLKNNPYLHSIQSLNYLSKLKALQTDNCPIETLPLYLPQLTDLHMSKNNLTNLIGIRTLGYKTNHRKFFYFNNNHIQSIPPQIQYVKNLYFLNLDYNHLISLPLDIFNVTTLHYLYIRYNNFSVIELKAIIEKFNITHPYMKLYYLNRKNSIVKNIIN